MDMYEDNDESKGLKSHFRYWWDVSKNYPILTLQQEQELIQSLKDKSPTELRNRLVLHNIRLVIALSSRYSSSQSDREDFVQLGMLGLWEAAQKFDIDKQNKFITYAFYHIKRRMGYEFRLISSVVDRSSFSMNIPIKSMNGKMEDSDTELANFVYEKFEPTYTPIKVEERSIDDYDYENLVKFIHNLLVDQGDFSENQIRCFMKYVSEDCTLEDCAELFGFSAQRAQQIVRSVRDSIRSVLVGCYKSGAMLDTKLVERIMVYIDRNDQKQLRDDEEEEIYNQNRDKIESDVNKILEITDSEIEQACDTSSTDDIGRGELNEVTERKKHDFKGKIKSSEVKNQSNTKYPKKSLSEIRKETEVEKQERFNHAFVRYGRARVTENYDKFLVIKNAKRTTRTYFRPEYGGFYSNESYQYLKTKTANRMD